MKNFKRKLSAVVLSAMFVSIPAIAFEGPHDTGLGQGLGGAVINNATGGLVDVTTGMGSADLNFNGNTHVNWDTLNVGRGESLNFNAVENANNLTILNTVNQGMTNVYGAINANDGIAKLIISNPNGVLFDGAQFTTAGDAMITTQPLTAEFVNGQMNIKDAAVTIPQGMIQIKDTNINVGGEFNILAPAIDIVKGHILANNGVKLVTQNGQDYIAANPNAMYPGVRMEAVNISPVFFEKAFEKIGNVNRERVLIVGDSLSSDILGAKNAGIKSCWYNPLHHPNTTAVRADYEIDHLKLIPEILGLK